MSWLQAATDEPTPFEGVLGLRPELLELYRSFYAQLWDSGTVPPNVIELCRLRIAHIHNCEAEGAIRHAQAGVNDVQIAALDDWRAAACFSPAERAALAFAEKMPWQHHGVTDADVAALREHLEDEQVVTLTLALGVGLFMALSKVMIVLGLEPEHIPTTILPTPGIE